MVGCRTGHEGIGTGEGLAALSEEGRETEPADCAFTGQVHWLQLASEVFVAYLADLSLLAHIYSLNLCIGRGR